METGVKRSRKVNVLNIPGREETDVFMRDVEPSTHLFLFWTLFILVKEGQEDPSKFPSFICLELSDPFRTPFSVTQKVVVHKWVNSSQI